MADRHNTWRRVLWSGGPPMRYAYVRESHRGPMYASANLVHPERGDSGWVWALHERDGSGWSKVGLRTDDDDGPAAGGGGGRAGA